MAPNNEQAMETLSAIHPGGRISSESSGSTQIGMEEKPAGAEESQENGVPKNENVVACLQVLGAFFMMFNSWYVHALCILP